MDGYQIPLGMDTRKPCSGIEQLAETTWKKREKQPSDVCFILRVTVNFFHFCISSFTDRTAFNISSYCFFLNTGNVLKLLLEKKLYFSHVRG